jgi:hypothetical protein
MSAISTSGQQCQSIFVSADWNDIGTTIRVRTSRLIHSRRAGVFGVIAIRTGGWPRSARVSASGTVAASCGRRAPTVRGAR